VLVEVLPPVAGVVHCFGPVGPALGPVEHGYEQVELGHVLGLEVAQVVAVGEDELVEAQGAEGLAGAVEVLGLLDEAPVGQREAGQQLGRERRGGGGQKARVRAQRHALHHVEAGEGVGRQLEQDFQQGIGQQCGLGEGALAHGHHGQQLRAG
jgi:hypothetical protein